MVCSVTHRYKLVTFPNINLYINDHCVNRDTAALGVQSVVCLLSSRRPGASGCL